MLHRLIRLVTLAACFFPLAVAAQENPAYQAAYDRGQKAFTEERYDVCAEEFRQAFNIEPRGNLLYNIAFCYEKANDLTNGLVFYQRFVEAVPNSPKRPAVERHISELQGQVQDQFEEVSVTSDPSGAMIFVDDKSRGAMGATPLTFKLLPGSYTIIGEQQGYERATRKIDLKKGAPAQVDLNLIDSTQVGTVQLMVTERDADIHVDKKKVGKAPLTEPLRLRRGPHEIMVMKTGFTTWTQNVDVVAGQTSTVRADLSSGAGGEGEGEVAGGGGGGGDTPLFTGPRLWPTILMGAGLAVIGGGIVTGLSSQGLYDDLSAKKKNYDATDRTTWIASKDLDTGKSRVLMTNILLPLGGAMVAGGAVWWFLAGRSGTSAESGISFAPTGSALVWGSF